MTQTTQLPPPLNRLRTHALVLAVLGLALCIVGLFVDRPQFFASWLLACVFWTSLTVGSLALLMLQHLTGGIWGLVIRRPLEAATRLLPLMALLFIPIILGLSYLYPWATASADPHAHLPRFKALYLNPTTFILRTILYFAIWLIMAFLLNTWSANQDRTASANITRRLQKLSGPGLVIYGLVATFAAIDWVMSLDPHWYSTIFGLLFIVGQALGALALAILIAAWLLPPEPPAILPTPVHFHDLGNLLLALVMLWAYLAFSQYLIIWSANLPEEIPYIAHRTRGGWQWIALLLVILHFFIPFILLLWRRTKRSATALAAVAVALLVMRLIDHFWIIAPAFDQSHEHMPRLHIHWLDLAAPVGIGGLWVFVYLWQLSRRPLLPLHDPRLQEVTGHA